MNKLAPNPRASFSGYCTWNSPPCARWSGWDNILRRCAPRAPFHGFSHSHRTVYFKVQTWSSLALVSDTSWHLFSTFLYTSFWDPHYPRSISPNYHPCCRCLSYSHWDCCHPSNHYCYLSSLWTVHFSITAVYLRRRSLVNQMAVSISPPFDCN